MQLQIGMPSNPGANGPHIAGIKVTHTFFIEEKSEKYNVFITNTGLSHLFKIRQTFVKILQL